MDAREILFLIIHIEKSFQPCRFAFTIFPFVHLLLVSPFSFHRTLFPDHPLSVSPWKSTLLPYFPPVFTQASLLAKLKILMRSWKSEIWYSSPFTLPLFAAAMLREKSTLQTNRKIRMKLIETKGWFCFRYDSIDVIRMENHFFFFNDSSFIIYLRVFNTNCEFYEIQSIISDEILSISPQRDKIVIISEIIWNMFLILIRKFIWKIMKESMIPFTRHLY